MQHDIIDNKDRKLADSIRPLLSESETAKFAVGYFFISGFKMVASELEKLKELRLLIGSVSDSRTIEQLAETHSSASILEQARRREFANAQEKETFLREVGESVRLRIGALSQTDEDEKLIQLLLKLIQERRFLVRVYTKSRLHAKAYIFDYPAGRYDRGMAIIGSSNLSLAGLNDNTELNVEVRGLGNHEQLTQWFNALWNDEGSKDFDALLMQELKASWALNSLSPYALFINVLLHLIRDRLEQAIEQMPSDFPPLADFQWAAVQTALRILRRQNGVILGDVVGFGKTYMGTAILKWLYARDRWRALIVTPKPLRKMWEKYNNDYGLRARVLTLGELRKPGFDWASLEDFEPSVVLIDESHNFRHSDTEQYVRLKAFLHSRGLPIIGLTATPRNRLARDVYNQLHLFHPDEKTNLGLSPDRLRDYFALIEKKERELPPLLQHFMVRRTRRHIREHWPHATIKGRPIRFPDRKLETISYNINQAYNGLYDSLRHTIEPPNPGAGKKEGLRYARYSLTEYVQPAWRSKKPYDDLKRAGVRLRGLMRALLFKRLESSVEAFRCTLNHLIESHRFFLKLLDEQRISAGDDVEALLKDLEEGDSDDEQLLTAIRAASGKYDIAHFDVSRLRADISADLTSLEKMRDTARPITPEQDAKLQRLVLWLDEQPLLRQHKLLIFTQFADTAHYLFKYLNPRMPNVQYADSGREDLDNLVKRFAPIANGAPTGTQKDPINVLISTDVLSEGLNLQDAAYIVNYDLHWNPVRLIQRFGRIDRIDTLHEQIFACNFLPDPKLEQHLGIRRTLSERITEIHASIGEDAPILEPDEEINEKAMYAIYEGDGKALEAIEEAVDQYDSLGIQAAEDMIRKLDRDDPKFMSYIRSLPNAVRTARQLTWPPPSDSPLAKLSGRPAIFFFGRAGEFQKLYLADDQGRIVAEDQSEAIAVVRCLPDDKALTLPPGYNQLVETVREHFEKAFREYVAEGGLPHALTPPQRRAVDLIQQLFKSTIEEEKRKELGHMLELYRLPIDGRTQSELREWRQTLGDDVATSVDRLRDIAFACKLEDMWVEQSRHSVALTEATPMIICTEALIHA